MGVCESCEPGETCGSVTCTVQKMIFEFPSLFANRTQALHHLFCVLGGGYEWAGGGLVDVFAHLDRDDRTEEKATTPIEVAEPSEYMQKYAPDEYQRAVHAYAAERGRLRGVRSRAAKLARTPGPLHRNPYNYSASLPLNKMPADARPDWAAAAAEISAVVEPMWAVAARRAADGEMARQQDLADMRQAIEILDDAEKGADNPFGVELANILSWAVERGHTPHQPGNGGAVDWLCLTCGDLRQTPEKCPGWPALIAAREIVTWKENQS